MAVTLLKCYTSLISHFPATNCTPVWHLLCMTFVFSLFILRPTFSTVSLILVKQPSFDWNSGEKYVELINIEMEVTDILHTKTYELTHEVKVIIIKNWLGRDVQLIKAFMSAEKETRKTGVFANLLTSLPATQYHQ